MSSLRKALVFFLLSAMFVVKLERSYGHSLLQRNSSRLEFDCTLTPEELQRYSAGEGRWLATNSTLQDLDGDIQTLVNCTREGDVILFDVEAYIQPSRRITIPWNLTISAFVEDPRMEDGTFLEATRRVIFLCPREDEGVFLVEANECLFANFIFQSCSLNSRDDEVPHGIITTASCSSSQNLGTVGLHHIDFNVNTLHESVALYVQEPSCSSIQVIDVKFQNNSCVGTCAASLSSPSEIQNIILTGNRFFEEDAGTPVLISVYSGSNTTIDGLIAAENNGTAVHVENANLTIRNSNVVQNSGVLNRFRYYTGGVTLLNSVGQILDCRFEENTGAVGSSIVADNSSIVVTRTSVIGNFASMHGGGIALWHCQSVRILDSIITNNTAGSRGGGLSSNDTRSLRIENTTFEANSASMGGGLYFELGDLEITNSIYQNNSASTIGAAMYFSKGTSNIKDSNFASNKASLSGAGAYIQSSNYSLMGLTIVQNEAANAGGIYVQDSSGSLNDSYFARNWVSLHGGGLYLVGLNMSVLHGCTFANNSASFGGSVYGMRLTLASVLSCHFIGNRASDSGGGAYFGDGNYTFEGNFFEENASSRFGGGLTCFNSTLQLNDTRFLRNKALISGGGTHVYGNTSSRFDSCTWEANTAPSSGGGAYFESGLDTMVMSSFFRLNQAGTGGGAYFTEANVTLLSVTGSRNTANESGGVLHLIRSSGTVSHCSFDQNTARYGGALASFSSFIDVSATNFNSNKASLAGGAIDCEGSGNMTMKSCSFESNFANRYAGAIGADNSVISATNLHFQNNRAFSFGGAVHMQRKASVSFSHSVFFNESSRWWGGALSATDAELNLRNISISSCSAVNGGGVYLSGSSASINETSVTFCRASESGGGIGMIRSNVTSHGINIAWNEAIGTLRYRPKGGGITVGSSSNLYIRNATIAGNLAQHGAGIFGIGESVVFVVDSEFQDNSATERGGAACFHESLVIFERVLFEQNRARHGGSLYVSNSSLVLNNSQLMNSSSMDAGGSVLAREDANVLIEETRIQSSSAVNGGGIMLVGSNFLGLRVQFQNCSAGQHGGGVGLNESSSFLCTECLLEGNSALQEGGALRLESLSPQLLAFQLENTTFRNNDAAFGGAIHFQTGDGSANCSDVNSTECTFLAVAGCVFVNNRARFSGGAILANNPNALRVSCYSSNKTDPLAYFTNEDLTSLSELSSLDVACNNWRENYAYTYGPIIGSYARRVSTMIMVGQNKTVEIHGYQYVLRGHHSGDPLPTISLKAVDEFGQGPALIQGNRRIEAVMTSPDGLLAGVFIVEMRKGHGNFSGITVFKEPGNYSLHIDFAEGDMATLTIAVEVRECLIGESRTANGTLCESCGDTTYNFDPLKHKECISCPDDAMCDSIAIRPKNGYWHQTPCSTHIQRCLSERACNEEDRNAKLLELGLKITNCTFDNEFVHNYSAALCREGYTGPLCGSCAASHGKTRSFVCEECYGRFISLFLVTIVGFILLGLAAYTIRSALPVRVPPLNGSLLRREEYPTPSASTQMVEMLSTDNVLQEQIHCDLQRQDTNGATLATSQQGRRSVELAKWKAVEILRITINYLQVISIAIALNIAWTGALIALFEAAEFMGGMTSEAAGRSTDCLISADSSIPRSAVRTIADLIIPVLVAAFFVVFWTIAKIKNKKGYSYLIKRCLLSALAVSYLSYIAITKTAVNVFYCVEIYDSLELEDNSKTKYWAVDTALKCYEGSHSMLSFVFGLPVLVVFSLGFPLLVTFVLILKRRQEGIQSPWLFETAGFLYRSYDERFIFWESVVLLRKAALAVIVVFAYPLGGNLQGILAVCVLVIALYFHTLCSPYRSEFDTLNRLEGLSLLISSLTFVSGLFFNDNRASSEARATITALVVFANIGLFFYLFARFVVVGTTYLGIILNNEGVAYVHNATAFHIMKTFLKNRLNVHFGPAVRYYKTSISFNDEGPETHAVEIEVPRVQ